MGAFSGSCSGVGVTPVGILEAIRFKTATRDDDAAAAETNYFKRMSGQKSCRILSIVELLLK